MKAAVTQLSPASTRLPRRWFWPARLVWFLVAEKIVAAFGAGLREKVDLDDLQIQVMSIVAETLQPETISLWLRLISSPGPEPASSRFPEITDADFNRRPGR